MEKLRLEFGLRKMFTTSWNKACVTTAPPPGHVMETECWTSNMRMQLNARHNARGILVTTLPKIVVCFGFCFVVFCFERGGGGVWGVLCFALRNFRWSPRSYFGGS